MNRITGRFLSLLLAPGLLLAQSKEETMKYIIDELRSLESNSYTIREIYFSPSGDTFGFKRGRSGMSDKGTIIPLDRVDIYPVTVHRATGIDYLNLMVRSRGKDGDFLANGIRAKGVRPLIGKIEDERKVKALARAFNHLIQLVTGRKDLFPVP
ncbi:MAG: hypothetical protein ABSH53_21305 [Holophaga sp.]|jgi:hypothetical protein